MGHFTGDAVRVVAPFELKVSKTGLDAIMPGRAKTPVQRAWEYANDAIGARWVLVSNMRILRLYAVGQGRASYEEFDLRKIGDPAELKRLQLFLHADNLLQFVRDQRAHIDGETRIATVQKLLDRVVFVAFAEDSVLVPDDSLKDAVEFTNRYDPQPKWVQVRRLFGPIDDFEQNLSDNFLFQRLIEYRMPQLIPRARRRPNWKECVLPFITA